MPSLWKRSKSQYWTACFTAADGRQLKRSTKTKDRRLAFKLAQDFEKAARQKRTAKQVRKVIEDLHRDLTGEELPSKSLSDFVAEWLREKEPETSAATLQAYKTASSKLLRAMGDKVNEEISLITEDDLMAFRNQAFTTMHGVTLNNTVKIIRMIFKAAHRKRLISENPAENLDTVKKPKSKERRPFKMDELRAVLAVADDEWKSLILFGLYTGQRLGDLARLTWANVDMERSTLILSTAKTGKNIMQPLAVPLRDHLGTLPAGDMYDTPLHPRAFAAVANTGHTSTLSRGFAELVASAGLRIPLSRDTLGNGRASCRNVADLSFHNLRHTASTLLREAGVPDAVVMEYIGHDDPAMSRHYTHVGREALMSAAAKLPDVLALPALPAKNEKGKPRKLAPAC